MGLSGWKQEYWSHWCTLEPTSVLFVQKSRVCEYLHATAIYTVLTQGRTVQKGGGTPNPCKSHPGANRRFKREEQVLWNTSQLSVHTVATDWLRQQHIQLSILCVPLPLSPNSWPIIRNVGAYAMYNARRWSCVKDLQISPDVAQGPRSRNECLLCVPHRSYTLLTDLTALLWATANVR